MIDINFNQYFYYDETSATCLRWNSDRVCGRGRVVVSAHTEAGHLSGDGYYHVGLKLDGTHRKIKVHHIVFMLLKGSRKEGFLIDHIDRDKKNNKIENLREVTPSQNMHNRPANNGNSVKGVYLSKRRSGDRWIAEWMELDGTRKTKSFSVKLLGDSVANHLAISARKDAEIRLNKQGALYND